MNIINLIFSSLIGLTAGSSAVKTVESVDINKYQGQWFEIAAIPQSFQKKFVKNDPLLRRRRELQKLIALIHRGCSDAIIAANCSGVWGGNDSMPNRKSCSLNSGVA